MGIFSDHYGRKKIIVLMSLIHITASFLTSFSNSFSMFVGIRFFVGGSIHAVWSAYFVLMAEIAPASKRTLCGGANTLLLLPRMIFLYSTTVYLQFSGVLNFGWQIGSLIMTLCAYFIRSWDYLQLTFAGWIFFAIFLRKKITQFILFKSRTSAI